MRKGGGDSSIEAQQENAPPGEVIGQWRKGEVNHLRTVVLHYTHRQMLVKRKSKCK
jgi:hypothetical protein